MKQEPMRIGAKERILLKVHRRMLCGYLGVPRLLTNCGRARWVQVGPVGAAPMEYGSTRNHRSFRRRLLERNLVVGLPPPKQRRELLAACRAGLGHGSVDMTFDCACRQSQALGNDWAGQPLTQ